jgi:hypothetical protein
LSQTFFLSNTMLLLHLLSRPLAMTQVNSSHTKIKSGGELLEI